ncbi:MAG: hypothetical protein ACYS1C_04660, partial [Planctomycetota bacterium]
MKAAIGCATAALVFVLVAAVIGVGVLYAMGRPQVRAVSIEQIQAREGVPVEVARPVVAEFTDYFYCDGGVVAHERSMLRAKVSEIVEAVHARVGDPVQKGQVLVEFRRTDFEADILAAETAHEEACNNYERYQSLWEQRVVSAERRDVARTRRDNAAAQLEAARS